MTSNHHVLWVTPHNADWYSSVWSLGTESSAHFPRIEVRHEGERKTTAEVLSFQSNAWSLQIYHAVRLCWNAPVHMNWRHTITTDLLIKQAVFSRSGLPPGGPQSTRSSKGTSQGLTAVALMPRRPNTTEDTLLKSIIAWIGLVWRD